MAPSSDTSNDILTAAADAAVRLAAARPWRQISLRDIAAAAGLDMAALYGVARSKDDVVDAIARICDLEAAERFTLDPDAPARERLLDAAVARFEAMEARRDGVAAIIEDALASPVAALGLWPRGARTARWLMELAGVDTSGARGAAKAQGFAAILARAVRTWLSDDAGDLARTIATLDRSLREAERWGERLDALRPDRAQSHSQSQADARASDAPSDETA